MNNKEAIAILTHNWKYRELIDNGYQYEALDLAIKALEEPEQGRFECRMKIKDLISMLLEFDMNEKATIYTPDENNIVISITDMGDKEAENDS